MESLAQVVNAVGLLAVTVMSIAIIGGLRYIVLDVFRRRRLHKAG